MDITRRFGRRILGSSPGGSTRVYTSVLLLGVERERGRENNCFPVKEGMGKPWVSQVFMSWREHMVRKATCVAFRYACAGRSVVASASGASDREPGSRPRRRKPTSVVTTLHQMFMSWIRKLTLCGYGESNSALVLGKDAFYH